MDCVIEVHCCRPMCVVSIDVVFYVLYVLYRYIVFFKKKGDCGVILRTSILSPVPRAKPNGGTSEVRLGKQKLICIGTIQ